MLLIIMERERNSYHDSVQMVYEPSKYAIGVVI